MARILYISQGYSTHDRRFLERLAATKHQVWFLPCREDPMPLESRPVPEGIRRLAPLAPGRSVLEPWVSARRLREHLRAIRPDLVHAGPVQTGAFYAALCGAQPLMVMSWGSDVLVAPDRSAWNRWVTRFTLSKARMVVADCRAVRDRVLRFSALKPEQIVHLPFGVDLREFAEPPRPAGFRAALGWEGCRVLLSTRSFEPGRGNEIFFEAIRGALSRWEDVRVIMAGEGSLRGGFVERVRKNGLSGRIHLPGQVPNDRMAGFFREADLYVSASESDGTSVSLLEAMASGLAVVVPDAYGNREWVRQGVNGWLYRSGDISALGSCIAEALERKEERERMGRANRALVAERADWEKNFERLLAGYDALLAGNGEGR